MLDVILEKSYHAAPAWEHIPQFDPTEPEFSGIRAITYDSMERNGQKTATFAYLGIPESTEPVPAIVLVHGGGGHAFLPWVQMWMARGYAAIAMDTRGCFPAGVNGGSRLAGDPGFRHGMYDRFLRPGYTDSPDEDGMEHAELPLEERWITRALDKVIRANNLLRSLPQVDKDRIGITGISWGGVITTLTITYDRRFAFAIPVYGSGYLDIAPTYIGDRLRMEGNHEYFRAEERFFGLPMPILWLGWNDDSPFAITSNSLSYMATAGSSEKTMLCMLHNMHHDHPSGWNPPIIAAYADWAVKGGAPLVTFATQPVLRNATARLNVPADAEITGATLYWIDAPMTYSIQDKYHLGLANVRYMDQVWQLLPAQINGDTVTACLPENACGYYLEVRYMTGGQELTATSVYTSL